MVKVEREREYKVMIKDEDGNPILEFLGIVVKKEQAKGFLGLSNKVEETLYVKDFDFNIFEPFKKLLEEKKE
jgi:hypothetical protein